MGHKESDTTEATDTFTIYWALWACLVAQLVKNPPAVWETWVWSLGWEDPLEEGAATHSSILAWRIPWPGQPMGSQRVGHNWANFTFTFIKPQKPLRVIPNLRDKIDPPPPRHTHRASGCLSLWHLPFCMLTSIIHRNCNLTFVCLWAWREQSYREFWMISSMVSHKNGDGEDACLLESYFHFTFSLVPTFFPLFICFLYLYLLCSSLSNSGCKQSW